MTYAEAVARLLALRGGEHAGMRPGLERIEGLLGALGRPEERYTLVQVGGTNGKGSVAAMLATILKYAGRRVGLYTSPHLVSFRERIRVDGDAIPEDAVVDGVDALGTLVARFDATMFEAATALALDHFARESVEVAVLEVGLGGRLDATTVGMPAVTVLASIAMDHEAWLGSTLGAIAEEKAAIIRSGVALSAAQEPEVAAVVERHAARARVPLLVAGRDLHVRVRERTLDAQRIDCAGPAWAVDDLALAMLGTYQPGNALLAVAAAQALGASVTAIREGLARTVWPGRFQVVRRDPWLVLDGAHNPAGAAALARSLAETFGDAPVTLVVATAADKDARGILAALVPRARRVVLTRSSSARSADPAALAAAMPATGPRAEIAPDVATALALAASDGGAPVTCVAGSLFLLGDVLRALRSGDDTPCSIEKAADSMGRLS
ncbi:MAG: bifunctional folylpolyglutamate synthase/dihydrofolate synthase [Candidatus Rokubacteria bacterium]|nr:bifunctional folylpolyglutamate synthase/dihydrofolate synthase [Candidatus Rokubacteria bacterium]